MWLNASMIERKAQDQDKFIIRLPDGMRDRIKAEADRNGRSMNAEIVATLENRYPEPLISKEDFAEEVLKMSQAPTAEERDRQIDAFNTKTKKAGLPMVAGFRDGKISIMISLAKD